MVATASPGRAQLDAWLSPSRFQPFVVAANGDPDVARQLYEWNAAVSGAFLEVFHHLEVVLRNAVDTVMTPLESVPSARLRVDQGWWFASSTFVTDTAVEAVAAARQRLGRGAYNRDRVLASLTFGCWVGLFGGVYEELFRQHLRRCFPGAAPGLRRKDVVSRLEQLRQLRNRIAHHEPVHQVNLAERYTEALEVIGWVDPAAAEWVASAAALPRILAQRPGPVPALAAVVAAAEAWPLYQQVGAYVCQPGRAFQTISHIGFYAERHVQVEIARVVDRRDDVPWNVHEVGRLMGTRDERDRWLADVMKASIAGGWTHLPRYQVFFLSRPGEPGHVTLAEPLVNPRRGRGSAWVQRQRYVLVSDLERASSTDQLDGGTLA